jgi:hypothetical protein
MTAKLALLFSMGVILGGCFGQFNSEGSNDWLIVPGERAGLIQKHTSERLLVEIFGPENVRREIIPQADGQELGWNRCLSGRSAPSYRNFLEGSVDQIVSY